MAFCFGKGAELIEHTCMFQREDDDGIRNVQTASLTSEVSIPPQLH